jgi:hypothetical protein
MVQASYVYISGICWIAAYALLVKRGFQDRSYGMPLVAMSGNLAWETVFSLVYPIGMNSPGRVIIFVWLILDFLIMLTFFLYGCKYFEADYHLTRLQFYLIGAFSLSSAYALFVTAPPFLLSLPRFSNDMFEVASFLAYALNLVISVLFVNMVLQRKSVEGQSFYIGLLKWLGTFLVAAWYLLEHNYPLIWFLVIQIEIFDIMYLVLIYRALRKAGVNAWLRL